MSVTSQSSKPVQATDSSAYPELGVRHFGRFNSLGLWTLYKKEVRRFTKVWMQTLMAPIITTLLFLAIFSLALAGLRPDINGVPFVNFLAPGLIMMALVQTLLPIAHPLCWSPKCRAMSLIFSCRLCRPWS